MQTFYPPRREFSIRDDCFTILARPEARVFDDEFIGSRLKWSASSQRVFIKNNPRYPSFRGNRNATIKITARRRLESEALCSPRSIYNRFFAKTHNRKTHQISPSFYSARKCAVHRQFKSLIGAFLSNGFSCHLLLWAS